MCQTRAGQPLGAVLVVIGLFLSPSLLTLSVNEIVLRQLTAALPALVSLSLLIPLCSQQRQQEQHQACAASPCHCCPLLTGMPTASLAAAAFCCRAVPEALPGSKQSPPCGTAAPGVLCCP